MSYAESLGARRLDSDSMWALLKDGLRLMEGGFAIADVCPDVVLHIIVFAEPRPASAILRTV